MVSPDNITGENNNLVRENECHLTISLQVATSHSQLKINWKLKINKLVKTN